MYVLILTAMEDRKAERAHSSTKNICECNKQIINALVLLSQVLGKLCVFKSLNTSNGLCNYIPGQECIFAGETRIL
jgi:hypothetical protein